MKKALSILLVVLATASNVFAPPPFPPPPSQAIPLDVVVGMLLVAGVSFGLFKLLNKKKPASVSAES